MSMLNFSGFFAIYFLPFVFFGTAVRIQNLSKENAKEVELFDVLLFFLKKISRHFKKNRQNLLAAASTNLESKLICTVNIQFFAYI